MDISLLPFAYLVPLGLLLASWASVPTRHLREATLAALVIAIASTVAYVGFGFALQFGGVGLHATAPAGLAGLDKAWSPFPAGAGSWDFLGLEGFFLSAQGNRDGLALVETLALHRLPLAIVAGLIPVTTLVSRVHRVALVAAGIVSSAVVFPIVGGWIWGGGWLASLGSELNLGHGAIDVAGSGIVYFASACVALVAARLAGGDRASESAEPALPQLHQPWLALLGAMLFALGSAAWSLSDPLLGNFSAIDFDGVAIVGLIGAGSATATAVAYLWLATGRISLLIAVRGWLSGWVAAAACALFISPGSAIVVGMTGGLLSIIGTYLAKSRLNVDDATGAIGSFGAAGAWGVIALGLFADGAFGSGWNGVLAAGGVRGLLAGDAGQLTAQGAALVAIGAFAACSALLLLSPAAILTRRFASRPSTIAATNETSGATPTATPDPQ